MSVRHLSCPLCRIRVLAHAPAIDLLEARCPICEATLTAASSASSVIGFRLFDLDAFVQNEPWPPHALAWPASLATHREAPPIRDDLDAPVQAGMSTPSQIEELRAEATYARERYHLYRAKMYSSRPTTMSRLTELERISQGAENRLGRAQKEHSSRERVGSSAACDHRTSIDATEIETPRTP